MPSRLLGVQNNVVLLPPPAEDLRDERTAFVNLDVRRLKAWETELHEHPDDDLFLERLSEQNLYVLSAKIFDYRKGPKSVPGDATVRVKIHATVLINRCYHWSLHPAHSRNASVRTLTPQVQPVLTMIRYTFLRLTCIPCLYSNVMIRLQPYRTCIVVIFQIRIRQCTSSARVPI